MGFDFVTLCMLVSLCVLSAADVTADVDWDVYACPRVRRAWHLISEDDRVSYANAMHQLNDQGVLAKVAKAHRNYDVSFQAHATNAFYPWHRYVIYETETQVRRLSEDYKCFGMPYWDMSHDSSREESPYIMHSRVGGNAIDVEGGNYCVRSSDDEWSVENFPLHAVCLGKEKEADACCLKRVLNPSVNIRSPIRYAHELRYNHPVFGKDHFPGFSFFSFGWMHGEGHGYLGGTQAEGVTQMITLYGPLDPAFYLLHTWMDYLWAVWMNCHGYDKVAPSELELHPHAYMSTDEAYDGLDTELNFAGVANADWWQADDKSYVPTPRKMFALTDWNVKYSMGSFIKLSHMSKLCNHDWNTDILVNEVDNVAVDDHVSTRIDIYNEIAHERMMDYFNKQKHDMENQPDFRESLFQSVAAMSCQFQLESKGQTVCYAEDIEVEYEKCDGMVFGTDISLEELLNKDGVKGNECLQSVRNNFYGYAKNMGILYKLCNGDYDRSIICEQPEIEFDKGGVIKEKMGEVDWEAVDQRLYDELNVHYEGDEEQMFNRVTNNGLRGVSGLRSSWIVTVCILLLLVPVFYGAVMYEKYRVKKKPIEILEMDVIPKDIACKHYGSV